MIWGLLPILLLSINLNTEEIGLIAAAYPTFWGIGQLFTGKMSDFYSIEYKLSDSTTNVQSKMFCKVEKGKAYSIIFSDSQESFKDNLNEVFLSIIKSFENE